MALGCRRKGSAFAIIVVLLLIAWAIGTSPIPRALHTVTLPAGTLHIASPGPVILNVTPWDGQFIGTKTPAIVVAYVDVNATILAVDFHLDRMNLTSAGVFNATSFALPMAFELRDGPHIAEFVAIDGAGETAYVNWTFVVDTIPPLLSVTAPGFPAVPGPAVPVEGAVVLVFPQAFPVNVTVTSLPLQAASWTVLPQNGTFQIVVPLAPGANVLFINATDRLGNLASDARAILSDTSPPPLTVLAPANQSVSPSNIVGVSGTTEFGAYLTVNGLNIAVRPDGTWSVNLALPDGVQLITVAATDAVGNTNVAIRAILVDGDVPEVRLTSPLLPITNRSEVVVSGYVTDSNAVAVLVNGLAASFNAGSGAFSRTLELPDGTNPIIVVAIDAAQHTGVAQTAIIVDTAAPHILVAEPLDGLETNQSTVIVAGSVDDRNATVLVNGQEIRPGADGHWQSTVALVAGENRIVVGAVDAAGNQAAAVVKVVTFSSPWPDLDTRISDQERMLSVWGSTLSLALVGAFLLLLASLFAMYLRLNSRIVRLRGRGPRKVETPLQPKAEGEADVKAEK
ncbi:MAG TPA: hypothetical protein VIB49_02005 [Thermoplasmata archaeon]|jgi:hypothetical protein